jgi:hypothetical protein
VHVYWARARPWIEAALACGEFPKDSPESIYERLTSAGAQMWLGLDGERIKALLLSEILIYPERKVCYLFLCTGQEFENWLRFLDNIEKWAKEVGCSSMELKARGGWEKVLKNYKRTHVVLEKEL